MKERGLALESDTLGFISDSATYCVALRKLLNITEPVYSSIQVRLLTRFTWLGWVPAKWGGAGEPLVECLVRAHIWCLFIPFISSLGKNGSGKMNGDKKVGLSGSQYSGLALDTRASTA